jgi:hypothetical protein
MDKDQELAKILNTYANLKKQSQTAQFIKKGYTVYPSGLKNVNKPVLIKKQPDNKGF